MKKLTWWMLVFAWSLMTSCENKRQPSKEIVSPPIVYPVTPTNAPTQPRANEVMKQSRYQSVIVKAYFKGNSLKSYDGGGFILDEKYLVTVYHTYLDDDMAKAEKMIVLFINKYSDELDSVLVNLDQDFKYKKFDFKKHSFTKGDRVTDFLVLPLARKVPVMPIEVDYSMPPNNETLYVTGQPFDDNGKILEDLGATRVAKRLSYISNGKEYFAVLGNIGQGFSGAPVLNSKGKTIGILTGGPGPNVKRFLQSFVKDSILDTKAVDEIDRAQNNGQMLAFGNSIRTLFELYLR